MLLALVSAFATVESDVLPQETSGQTSAKGVDNITSYWGDVYLSGAGSLNVQVACMTMHKTSVDQYIAGLQQAMPSKAAPVEGGLERHGHHPRRHRHKRPATHDLSLERDSDGPDKNAPCPRMEAIKGLSLYSKWIDLSIKYKGMWAHGLLSSRASFLLVAHYKALIANPTKKALAFAAFNLPHYYYCAIFHAIVRLTTWYELMGMSFCQPGAKCMWTSLNPWMTEIATFYGSTGAQYIIAAFYVKLYQEGVIPVTGSQLTTGMGFFSGAMDAASYVKAESAWDFITWGTSLLTMQMIGLQKRRAKGTPYELSANAQAAWGPMIGLQLGLAQLRIAFRARVGVGLAAPSSSTSARGIL
tara:strand:- start:50 stop:1123 length:1074 start_codon:yes stop_codon:yes gene_type:complete